jgi:hypothetical protein
MVQSQGQNSEPSHLLLGRDRLCFSHQPVDVAVFAAYPAVSQAEIAHPQNRPRPARRGRRTAHVHKHPGKTGRSINERAGDEFV